MFASLLDDPHVYKFIQQVCERSNVFCTDSNEEGSDDGTHILDEIARFSNDEFFMQG
jgi:hypothetical protein